MADRDREVEHGRGGAAVDLHGPVSGRQRGLQAGDLHDIGGSGRLPYQDNCHADHRQERARTAGYSWAVDHEFGRFVPRPG